MKTITPEELLRNGFICCIGGEAVEVKSDPAITEIKPYSPEPPPSLFYCVMRVSRKDVQQVNSLPHKRHETNAEAAGHAKSLALANPNARGFAVLKAVTFFGPDGNAKPLFAKRHLQPTAAPTPPRRDNA